MEGIIVGAIAVSMAIAVGFMMETTPTSPPEPIDTYMTNVACVQATKTDCELVLVSRYVEKK